LEIGKLNDWEQRFIDSIKERRGLGLDISFKQSKKLNEIYQAVSSSEG
jgi:hypothetical protein